MCEGPARVAPRLMGSVERRKVSGRSGAQGVVVAAGVPEQQSPARRETVRFRSLGGLPFGWERGENLFRLAFIYWPGVGPGIRVGKSDCSFSLILKGFPCSSSLVSLLFFHAS